MGNFSRHYDEMEKLITWIEEYLEEIPSQQLLIQKILKLSMLGDPYKPNSNGLINDSKNSIIEEESEEVEEQIESSDIYD